jgi:hypothetical protein
MSNVRYQITNKELFNSILDDVNTDTLRVGTDHLGRIYFVGALDLILKQGGSTCWDGEHSPNDFQESYGFVLTLND